MALDGTCCPSRRPAVHRQRGGQGRKENGFGISLARGNRVILHLNPHPHHVFLKSKTAQREDGEDDAPTMNDDGAIRGASQAAINSRRRRRDSSHLNLVLFYYIIILALIIMLYILQSVRYSASLPLFSCDSCETECRVRPNRIIALSSFNLVL